MPDRSLSEHLYGMYKKKSAAFNRRICRNCGEPIVLLEIREECRTRTEHCGMSTGNGTKWVPKTRTETVQIPHWVHTEDGQHKCEKNKDDDGNYHTTAYPANIKICDCGTELFRLGPLGWCEECKEHFEIGYY